MVSSLVLLSNREGFSTQSPHDLPRRANRRRIAFHCKGHSPERRHRSSHKCHQGMNRSNRRSTLAQRLQFVARQCTAGVERNFFRPVNNRSKLARRRRNLTIGHTEPDKIGIQTSAVAGRGVRLDSSSQITGLPF